jgi:hypothetical protein
LHDAISVEKLGSPAAAVMTEPFVPTAKALAAVLGLPNYPLCVIQHPISSDDDAALRVKAVDAVRQIVAILMHGHPNSAGKF